MGKPIYLNYQNQSNASAFIHDEKIIVLWEEIVDEELDFCIHAAIFDLNGEPIGENYKYNLTPFEYVQREYDAFINDSYLYLTFRDFSNYTFNFNKIITQKYSLTNNSISPVWDGVGKPVVIDDYHHSKPSTVPMYSRVLVAWEKSLSVPTDPERDSDIYMNMLDPVSGNILGQPTGFVVNNHNKDQIDPIVTKNNNTLVSVVWRDGLSSGKEPIHGLYMQRVNTGTFTPANDLAVDTPAPFKSLGNYPNPFNPETKIAFNMNFTAEVKIDVFNIKGQKIKSLVNELMEKGNHTVLWNGTNDQNNPVSSGLYFYKISTKDHSSTHKMLLLK